MGSKKERIKFNTITKKFPVLVFDSDSATVCSEIDAELRKEGKTRSPIDLQIASIALSNDETLLTNDKDFNIIKELFDLKTEKY